MRKSLFFFAVGLFTALSAAAMCEGAAQYLGDLPQRFFSLSES